MADKSSHKAKTRARILDEAAGAIRASGVQGVSVAELMKRAGLTHGGFYAHFSSRDDLVSHAIDRMFEDNSRMLTRFLGDEPDLAGFVDYYLSDRALGSVEVGCPIPSLAGEAARMPTDARSRFEIGITRFRDRIAIVLRGIGIDDSQVLASSVLSELVGSMTLARAMPDKAAAAQYLQSSRDRIKDRLGVSAGAEKRASLS